MSPFKRRVVSGLAVLTAFLLISPPMPLSSRSDAQAFGCGAFFCFYDFWRNDYHHAGTYGDGEGLHHSHTSMGNWHPDLALEWAETASPPHEFCVE